MQGPRLDARFPPWLGSLPLCGAPRSAASRGMRFTTHRRRARHSRAGPPSDQSCTEQWGMSALRRLAKRAVKLDLQAAVGSDYLMRGESQLPIITLTEAGFELGEGRAWYEFDSNGLAATEIDAVTTKLMEPAR